MEEIYGENNFHVVPWKYEVPKGAAPQKNVSLPSLPPPPQIVMHREKNVTMNEMALMFMVFMFVVVYMLYLCLMTALDCKDMLEKLYHVSFKQ